MTNKLQYTAITTKVGRNALGRTYPKEIIEQIANTCKDKPVYLGYDRSISDTIVGKVLSGTVIDDAVSMSLELIPEHESLYNTLFAGTAGAGECDEYGNVISFDLLSVDLIEEHASNVPTLQKRFSPADAYDDAMSIVV